MVSIDRDRDKVSFGEERLRLVLEDFGKVGVRYAFLRNYDNLGKEEDFDLLVSSRHGFRVRKVLLKHGLVRRLWGWGPRIVSDRRFDIKPGCLEYKKCFLESADSVFSRCRKFRYFFVLSFEDELVHLILKSLGKGFDKSKYRSRIEWLFGKVDVGSVELRFSRDFGSLGSRIFSLVRKRQYVKVSLLEREFFSLVNTPFRRLKYFFNRLTFPCLKR